MSMPSGKSLSSSAQLDHKTYPFSSALAALDGSEEPENAAPSEAGSPSTAKAQPASIDATAAAANDANNA